MKKAQGLALNTIIIAALVLIVLVIIVMIFTGRISLFSKGIDTCSGDCSTSINCGVSGDLGIPMNPCRDATSPGKEGYTDKPYCCPKK